MAANNHQHYLKANGLLNWSSFLKPQLRNLKALIDLLDFDQYCNNIVKLLVILSEISTSWKLVLIHCYAQIVLKIKFICLSSYT